MHNGVKCYWQPENTRPRLLHSRSGHSGRAVVVCMPCGSSPSPQLPSPAGRRQAPHTTAGRRLPCRERCVPQLPQRPLLRCPAATCEALQSLARCRWQRRARLCGWRLDPASGHCSRKALLEVALEGGLGLRLDVAHRLRANSHAAWVRPSIRHSHSSRWQSVQAPCQARLPAPAMHGLMHSCTPTPCSPQPHPTLLMGAPLLLLLLPCGSQPRERRTPGARMVPWSAHSPKLGATSAALLSWSAEERMSGAVAWKACGADMRKPCGSLLKHALADLCTPAAARRAGSWGADAAIPCTAPRAAHCPSQPPPATYRVLCHAPAAAPGSHAAA